MYEAHFNQLQQLAHELRHTSSLDAAVWIFTTALTQGLNPDTKNRTFRAIIARLAAEAGIKLEMDVQGLCLQCGEPFDRNVSGRPKIYCSNACKQKAKRARKKLS